MKPEKPHYQPFAGWRPRKANSVIQSQVQRPENHGSCWCKSQWEKIIRDVPVQSVRQEKRDEYLLPPFLFCSDSQ